MKPKTDAYKKVEAMRDQKHKGWQKITAKNLSCVVYLSDNAKGNPIAYGYVGKSQKPSVRHCFRTQEARTKYVSEWIASIIENSERQASFKAEPRMIEVGDVLRASWGYDQTNIDYYKVTKLIGKAMVEVVKIGKQSIETNFMQGDCVPDPENVIGEPMRRRARGDSVKINNVFHAFKMQPKTVAGAKVYNASHWTAYH